MSMPEAEQQGRSLAPGMEEIVRAGDSLIIRDSDGQEVAITARESEETMDFLKAFDEWFHVKEGGLAPQLEPQLWTAVRSKFNALPMRLQRELPSLKGGLIRRG